MLPIRFLRLGPLFAAVLCFAQGPEPRDAFEALKQALGLTNAQIAELQRDAPRGRREDAIRSRGSVGERGIVIHFPEGMDDTHRTRLSEIATVLKRKGAATMAIDVGFVRPEQWPGGGGSMCHYPFDYYASSPLLSDFGMTRSQIEQLAAMMRLANEPAWVEVREKSMQRQALLDSGVSVDAPAVVQLGSDSNRLQNQISGRPSRDLVMSILDSTQKAKLAEFEKELDLAREAVELGLIYDELLYAEVLCH